MEKIKYWEAVLSEQYKPADVAVNKCTLTEKGAEFEFLKGQTVEEVLDEYIERDDLKGFIGVIKNYAAKLEQLVNKGANNIDLIFSNIILIDGKWNIIDFEWTFEAEVPLKFILHRAIVLYFEQKEYLSLQCGDICRMLGITEIEQERFFEWEHQLQLHLLGITKTMEYHF